MLRASNHVLALTEGQFQGRGTNKIKQGDGVCHLTFAILCYHHKHTWMELSWWQEWRLGYEPKHHRILLTKSDPGTATAKCPTYQPQRPVLCWQCHHTSRTAFSHLVEFGCSRLLMPLPQLGQVWNVLSAPEPIEWAWNLPQISFSLCPILFSSSLRDDAVQ